MKILDVVSASCFWGRIVEHRLPFEGRAYDTTACVELAIHLNMFYGQQKNRRLCTGAEKFDICVIKTVVHGYQRYFHVIDYVRYIKLDMLLIPRIVVIG